MAGGPNPAAAAALTKRNTNPYPDHPDAKFVNGKWVVPGVQGPQGFSPKDGAQGPKGQAPPSKKIGTSALAKLLAGRHPGSTPDLPFDPTKGWPTAPKLTTFPGLDMSTLPDGSDVPDTPARAFARTKASLLDPTQFANLEGRKSYQPLIDELGGQQSRLGAGVADANAMLDKSYGDASSAAYRGAQVVKDSNAQSNQSLTDLAARLAQVAGGDPTAAAAVGQASANQQANDSRFASVAEQAQADQAAAAQRDLGTAKLGYKSSTDKAIADLATQKATAQTQGSQAQGKAIEEALGFNDSQRTSALNRDVASQEAWLAGQEAGADITAKNLQNEGTRAGLKIGAHNAAVNDWTTLNTAKRQSYLDTVTRITDKATAFQMKQALIKGQTPVAELALADPSVYSSVKADLDQAFTTKTGPAADPGTIYSQAIRQMATAYPDSSNKAIKALALRYAQSQMTMWNSQHAKGQGNSGKTWKIVKGAPALVKA